MAITKRSEGVWQVVLPAGWDVSTNRYRRVSKTVRGTKRDAQKVEAELLTQLEAGQVTAGTLERLVAGFAQYRANAKAYGRPALRDAYVLAATPEGDRAVNDEDRSLLGAIAAALPRRLREGWIVAARAADVPFGAIPLRGGGKWHPAPSGAPWHLLPVQ
jgi:hypothetical protein